MDDDQTELETGFVLFAGLVDRDMDEARDYIKRNGLTEEDVRLVKTEEGLLCVKTKKPMALSKLAA